MSRSLCVHAPDGGSAALSNCPERRRASPELRGQRAERFVAEVVRPLPLFAGAAGRTAGVR